MVTASRELAGFMSQYDRSVAALGRAALARLKRRLPGARMLVYDNYNALVVGFGPSDRTSDAVLSIALYPRWVTLFFLKGASLRDPQNRLQGNGRQVRSVRLNDAADLDEPYLSALIAQAVGKTTPAFAASGGRLVIRSISPTRRPRRASPASSRAARA